MMMWSLSTRENNAVQSSRVANWVPRSTYIPTQSLAPLKEIMMMWSLSTRENNAVQSSRVAVNVSKQTSCHLEKGVEHIGDSWMP
uniref:Uncharacterized protein n=1 Tax=Romanomermis culicivorax TaxID=13658 RepID=A0A915JYY9_ROMCU